VQASEILALDARLAVVDATLRSLSDRPSAAASPASAQPIATLEQLQALTADVKALRDALAAELRKVDERLVDLRRRIDEQTAPRTPREGPLTEEEESDWAARARDPDPGVRCSALWVLGRARTERSVHVSLERLADEDPEVVVYAMLNLGRFKERAAAGKIVPLLGHADVALRATAYQALLAMGAPKEPAFDSTALPEKRRAAVEALKKWAESP